jgi:hypothetical protein
MENSEDNKVSSQNDISSSAKTPMGMNMYWIIGVIVVLALGALWYFSLDSLNEDVNVVPDENIEKSVIDDIETEIDDIDLGDLDADFEAIDKDLESL